MPSVLGDIRALWATRTQARWDYTIVSTCTRGDFYLQFIGFWLKELSNVLIQTLIVSPMELVKTQMQVGGETSISGTLKHIYQAAGASGLARGMGITFTREVPAFGIYFGAYEIMIR